MVFLKENKLLTVIIAGSFVLSLFYAFYFRITPVVDAKAYDRIAWNLVQGNGFRENAETPFRYDWAMLRAGPGYEFLLAGVYFVFGHRFEPVWVLQALLHALTALLVYAIARELFAQNGRQAGLLAAAAIAISPDLIEISAMLMTETLYVFCTALAVYLFLRQFRPGTGLLGALSVGTAVGVGILTRPTLVLFIPIMVFFYLSRKKYVAAVMLAVCSGLILLPWVLRNYLLFNQIITTTLIGSYNIWLGNTLFSDGGQYNSTVNPLISYVTEHGLEGLKKHASGEFMTFLLSHPLVFIKLCAIRVVRYFSLLRPMGFWFYQVGVGKIAMVGSSLVWIAALFISGFAGLAKLVREKNQTGYFFVALALSAPLLLFLTAVQSRYRFQIYPFLAVSGAGLIVAWWQQRRIAWKESYFVFPVLFLLVISTVDLLSSVPVILAHLKLF